QCFLVTQPTPVVAGAALCEIGEVGFPAIADIKQIAQHLDGVALSSIAEERGNGHAQMLSQEIEQGRLCRRDRMNRDPQIEGLRSAARAVPIAKLRAYSGQQGIVSANGAVEKEGSGLLQRLADLLTARDLADTNMSRAVLDQNDVAREERSMCAAQVQQHAVLPGNRDHRDFRDAGGITMDSTLTGGWVPHTGASFRVRA